ncbi:MAG: rod shape-determining protein MreC [Treponema sp.]|nr:rod shape-determining protein MreC [Treponema sp.]
MKSSKYSVKSFFSEMVFVVFLILSSVMLAFSSGGFILNFKQIGFSLLSSAQRGINAVATTVVDTVNAVNELSKLREENAALVEKLKNYEYMQRTNVEIRKENERLLEQLDFSRAVPQKNFAARIIGRDPDGLYSALTIDKGSIKGIKKNMPVIAIQNGQVGIVGKVVTVGLLTSLVMPVYDVKCSLSVRIQDTRDIGIVSGAGNSDTSLLLRYIKKRSKENVKVGGVIVTSGESKNYPRDIPVGTIIEARAFDYDSSLEIDVTPVIDFSRLETVLVLDLSEFNPSFAGSQEN